MKTASLDVTPARAVVLLACLKTIHQFAAQNAASTDDVRTACDLMDDVAAIQKGFGAPPPVVVGQPNREARRAGKVGKGSGDNII